MRGAVPALLGLVAGVAAGLECSGRNDATCTPANGCCVHVDGACDPLALFDETPFAYCAAPDCAALALPVCQALQDAADEGGGFRSPCTTMFGFCGDAACSDTILYAADAGGADDWPSACGARPGCRVAPPTPGAS